MASSGSAPGPFEPPQVSLVPEEEALGFFEEHGFFYKEDPKIGELVEGLYVTDRQRSIDARIRYFEPTLNIDPCIRSILKLYPIEVPKKAPREPLSWPWGELDYYFNWITKEDPRQSSDLIVYMAAPGSHWTFCDHSHTLDLNGRRTESGPLRFEDNDVEAYQKIPVSLEKGGVLLVKPRFIHRSDSGRSTQSHLGRSIMLGIRKQARPPDAPQEASERQAMAQTHSVPVGAENR